MSAPGRPRRMPGVRSAPDLWLESYTSETAAEFRLGFVANGILATEVGIWTSREGVEALRDLCNVLLVTEPWDGVSY